MQPTAVAVPIAAAPGVSTAAGHPTAAGRPTAAVGVPTAAVPPTAAVVPIVAAPGVSTAARRCQPTAALDCTLSQFLLYSEVTIVLVDVGFLFRISNKKKKDDEEYVSEYTQHL